MWAVNENYVKIRHSKKSKRIRQPISIAYVCNSKMLHFYLKMKRGFAAFDNFIHKTVFKIKNKITDNVWTKLYL